MKQDNRGTTLIELIVVIAIMAVLAGILINTTGFLTGKKAKDCAYRIIDAMSQVRNETMGKSKGGNDISLAIVQQGDEIYGRMDFKGTVSEVLLGKSGLMVVGYDSDGNQLPVEGSNELVYSFDRATGGLYDRKRISYYTTIVITEGNVSWRVTIEPITGRTAYERN